MKTRFQIKETIVTIICDDGLLHLAEDAIFDARSVIESKIAEDPFFGITYDPYPVSNKDEVLIQRMCRASELAGVGPMAGVAGAVASYSAEKLVEAGSRIAIIENGGDIAFCSPEEKPVGLFADHPTFRNLAFMMQSDKVTGICSSSKKIGPSVSLGNSNISTVLSDDVILADCCATALGNLVTDENALTDSCEKIGTVEGVKGCLACCGDKIAVYGDLPELVRADCSRLSY